MKKMIVLMFFIIPLSATADNIIFNPGFDMTPWDTGWARETIVDTTNHSGSGWTEGSATIEASNLSVSSPRSCNLRAYIACGNQAGTYGEASASAGASITQMFSPISNCLFKVLAIDSFYAIGKYYDFYDNIQLCINGEWKKIFKGGIYNTWTEICTTITESDTVTGVTFASYEIWGGAGTAGWICIRDKKIWIDNVEITSIGLEERRALGKERGALKVKSNPFVNTLSIKNLNSENTKKEGVEIQIYDIKGNLVEETSGNIIGKNLIPGIYFIKAEGYNPIKIVKLGGVK